MAHWPMYMYKQELIELLMFEDYDVEVWATRRGINGDVYGVIINNIMRDIPHSITDDSEAVGYVVAWLRDRKAVRKEFNLRQPARYSVEVKVNGEWVRCEKLTSEVIDELLAAIDDVLSKHAND